MDVKNVYTSCGCNRAPFTADWGRNQLLAYASCKAVVICQQQRPTKVLQTLAGHKERVNCVRWIPHDGVETELVSGSTDKSVIVWRKSGNDFELLSRLEGHTGTVTVVAGVYIGNHDNPTARTLVASASVDFSVKIWERKHGESEFSCKQTISFGTGFALALCWIIMPNTSAPLLACGGDDQKVHLLKEQDDKFVSALSLTGHEDWIRGLDFTVDDSGDMLLASSAQDHYIRIWRLSHRDPASLPSPNIQDLSLDQDLRMKETTFTVKVMDTELCFAVTLESVLQGHEGWIYSVRWHPPVVSESTRRQPLALLSASMDKTLIIWQPDSESDVWVEQVRVGDVGGNSLGFYGGMFGPDGRSILAHGYQGGFYVWHQQQDSTSWLPGVTVGGHFGSVEDVAWEPQNGEFLISVSLDQTSRLHGYWSPRSTCESAWHELARPQVHGYDIQTLTMLNRWCFASGADEKVIRVFEAPRNFMENMHSLSGLDVTDVLSGKGVTHSAEGASVPALGLSNKAIFQDTTAPPSDDREINTGSKALYPEFYFSPLSLQAPPSEDNLLQNTLWPEIQKLYGHGYEIFCLAYHPRCNILASACKAAKAEHAAIILWDVSSWKQVCRLDAHSLTVTQLRFTHSGEYLLSVSRDRTWSLFRCRQENQPASDPPYTREACTDKKTAVHTRIIWSAAWSHDDKYFVTVSRDKKAVVWTAVIGSHGDGSAVGDHGYGSSGNHAPCGMPVTLSDSITAVDFAPCHATDGSYLLAFGLDNGCINIYKYRATSAAETSGTSSWLLLTQLNQSSAHHLTVKRLQFRPVVSEVGSACESQMLQLVSCGADHAVKIYTLTEKSS